MTQTPLPDRTLTQSMVLDTAPVQVTRFMTPRPFRVDDTPPPGATLTPFGTSQRYIELQQTLVIVQPTHYYNATLTQEAASALETWQAQPTYTVTPTATRDYIWYNGCCWAYFDGQGWVVMPTPVPTQSQ